MIETTEFEFTPPNHVWFKSVGFFRASAVQQVMDKTAAAVKDQPYFFLTIDLTEFKRDESAGRKYATEVFSRLPPRAVAIVADNFFQRNLAKMLFKAVSIFPGGWRQHTEFFRSGEPIEPWFESPALIEKLEAAAQRYAKEKASNPAP